MSRFFRSACLGFVLLFGASCAHSEERIAEANFYTKLGVSNLVSQNYTEALRFLLEAEKRDPNNAELQNALGLSYYYKGEYKLAVDAYKKAVELKPDFSEASNNLGATYAAIGQYDNAIAAFDVALKNILYDTPERAWLNKGDAYAARLNSKMAMQSYEKAVNLAMPKAQSRDVVCVTYNRMAQVNIRDKRFVDAVRALQSAVKLCPKYSEPYFQLSNAYSRMGKRDEAIKACEKVKVLAPDTPSAQSCINLIELSKGKSR